MTSCVDCHELITRPRDARVSLFETASDAVVARVKCVECSTSCPASEKYRPTNVPMQSQTRL